MKYLFGLMISCVCSMHTFAQTPDLRRKITVTGTAETEITPDILYIAITLKEYFNGNKKAVNMDDLEKQLQQAVTSAGLPKENLTVSNLSGWNDTWQRKKNPNFAVTKQYRLKVNDPHVFDQIVSALDPKAVINTSVESFDDSHLIAYKKDLRLKALQAALQKAKDMAGIVNDTIGDALDIEEIQNDDAVPQIAYANNISLYGMQRAADDTAANIDFKTIKLKSQVRVVFQLN